MNHAIDIVIAILLVIAGLVMEFVAFIDGLLATLMTSAHIPANAQTVLLVIVALLLIVLAIRIFGRLIAGLLIILLVLMALHQMFPSLDVPQGHLPAWLHQHELPRTQA